MSATFQADCRLLKPSEFQAVFKRRQSAHNACFGIYAIKNQVNHPRLGLVVSKKVSKKAVIRNRIKRQVRESFRLRQTTLDANDFVVVAKAPLADRSRAAIRAEIDALWNQAIKRCRR